MDIAILLVSSCLLPITTTSLYFTWRVHNLLLTKKEAQRKTFQRLSRGGYSGN